MAAPQPPYGRHHNGTAIDCILSTLDAPPHVKADECRDMERRFPGVGWGALADEYEAATE